RQQQCTADERQACRIESHQAGISQRAHRRRARRGCRALTMRVVLAMAAEDVLHPIFELELALFEVDFFELLGFGEVMPGGQFVPAIFPFGMLGRERLEFLVGPHQLILQILRLYIHAPPPWDMALNTTTLKSFQGSSGRVRFSRHSTSASSTGLV